MMLYTHTHTHTHTHTQLFFIFLDRVHQWGYALLWIVGEKSRAFFFLVFYIVINYRIRFI